MTDSISKILASRFNKDEIVIKLNANPRLFTDTFELALLDIKSISWRAAWVIGHCTSKKDSRITPYHSEILNVLPQKGDGHQRELFKLLEKTDVPDELEGTLFNQCATVWEDVSKSPSVRLVVFRIMIKLSKKYPELGNEIKHFAQNHYIDCLSLGIKRSLQRELKKAKS